jgi:hypothetical protein
MRSRDRLLRLWDARRLVFSMAIILAVGFTVLEACTAFAQEQRCNELGANCVCSEPLTSPTIMPSGSGSAYFKGSNPNTKPCAMDGQTGYGIRNDLYGGGTPPNLVVKSDATTLNKLPNRDASKTAYYLSTPSGWTGDWMIGHSTVSDYARVAFRFYLYRSSDFQHTSEGTCTNSKEAGVRGYGGSEGGWAISSEGTGRYPHAYSLLNFTWSGHPSGADGFEGSVPWGSGTWNVSGFKDKWVRIEVVTRKPNAAGHDLEVYVTDITGGGTQQQVMKLSNGCATCVYPYQPFVWDSSFRTTTTLGEYIAMLYRAAEGGGRCGGWQGALYFTIAAWSTDAGQMIGAAKEVEGGGGLTPPPGPSSLNVN